MSDWAKYGMLNSPMEILGLEKALYNENKKVERLTNTNEYIKGKTSLISELSKNIDSVFENIMENENLKD
eukprot:gene11184-4004_t